MGMMIESSIDAIVAALKQDYPDYASHFVVRRGGAEEEPADWEVTVGVDSIDLLEPDGYGLPKGRINIAANINFTKTTGPNRNLPAVWDVAAAILSWSHGVYLSLDDEEGDATIQAWYSPLWPVSIEERRNDAGHAVLLVLWRFDAHLDDVIGIDHPPRPAPSPLAGEFQPPLRHVRLSRPGYPPEFLTGGGN